MTSCSKKDDRGLMFKTSRPHFFKIILDHTICDKKLGIPRKFAKKYGNDLSSSVILKVPSGAKWLVEIVKCDAHLWLQTGWQEFSQYYSLAPKSFLVFEFDKKNCGFKVIIFDKSASEIDYPLSEDNTKPTLAKECQESKIQENDDHSVEILGRKTKRKSLLPNPVPHKKMKLQNSTKFPTGGKDRKAKNVAKANVIKRARANFESKNPYFKLVIQPSHVYPVYRSRIHIPASFAKKYLNKMYGNVTLNVLDGRTWSVEYNIRMSHTTPTVELVGWKKFAQDNQLKVGDLCEFEMINTYSRTTALVFKVAISQDTKAANCSTSLCNKKKLMNGRKHLEKPSCSILSEAANDFTSVYPFFKSVMTLVHLKRANVYVPGSFNMNMKESTCNTTLKVKNRCWPVKLIMNMANRNGRFSAGWILFARDNSLQVGDTCIFELISRKTMLIKVSIFRHAIDVK